MTAICMVPPRIRPQVYGVVKSANSVANQTITVTLPTDRRINDICFIYLTCLNTRIDSGNIPVGWGLPYGDYFQNRTRMQILAKVILGTEANTLPITLTGVNDSICAAAFILRGVPPSLLNTGNQSSWHQAANSPGNTVTSLISPPCPTVTNSGESLVIRAVSAAGESAGQGDGGHVTWPSNCKSVCDYVGGFASDTTPMGISIATQELAAGPTGAVNPTFPVTHTYCSVTVTHLMYA